MLPLLASLALAQPPPNTPVASSWTAPKVDRVVNRIVDNVGIYSNPMNPLTFFSTVSGSIQNIAGEKNSPACPKGRLRLNGSCVTDETLAPTYDLCEDECRFDSERNHCVCVAKVESEWRCPRGVGGMHSKEPADYAVSISKSRMEFEVRPIEAGENLRKLPKNHKVVKLCVQFHVGLIQPVCDEDYPNIENERCFKDVVVPPKVTCPRLLKKSLDPLVQVDNVVFHCDTDYRYQDRLMCECTWTEATIPNFKCPKPFARRDGAGDYYTNDEMQELKYRLPPSEFPLKLCRAKEFIQGSCAGFLGRETLSNFPNMIIMDPVSTGDVCLRDLFHPPTDQFCAGEEMELNGARGAHEGWFGPRGACHLDQHETAQGNCPHTGAAFIFDEHSQQCSHRVYALPTESTCDHIFDQPPPDPSLGAIVKTEKKGDTCSLTRFLPAVNSCENASCEKETSSPPLPRCQMGKLTGKGRNAKCVVKSIKKPA